MKSDVYLKCDVLEDLPKPNRDNWLFEIEFLKKELEKDSSVLQVGSMDGTRIKKLLEIRADIDLTGLEIEKKFVELSKEKDLKANFVVGDITDPPFLPSFDYVICLNNTLGYISDQEKAIEEMKRLGKTVILSVYGEKFDKERAKEYFDYLGLNIRVKRNEIVLKDFGSMRKYTKKEVKKWGKVVDSPLGYIGILKD